MTDNEKIAKLAVNIADLQKLQNERITLIATMVRGCLARLKSNSLAARKEAIKALGDLADLLEGRNQI